MVDDDERQSRTLVCGWFSVEGGEATAGDLLSMEAVVDLATEQGAVDVAMNRGFAEGPSWQDLDPGRYDRFVFVCGPLSRHDELETMLDRFDRARKVAVNVSVVDEELAGRFDAVIARDHGDEVQPDLSLTRPAASLPVVGVVRSHAQPEYPAGRHEHIHDLIRLMLASRPCSVVDFDTRVHPAADPLDAHARSSEEVGALAGRMDVVVTTRLHGLVLSLGNGTPVLAIDPIDGGAKVARQASALGWPCIFTPEQAAPEQLSQALDWCLTDDAREQARKCVERLAGPLDDLEDRIRAALSGTGS